MQADISACIVLDSVSAHLQPDLTLQHWSDVDIANNTPYTCQHAKAQSTAWRHCHVCHGPHRHTPRQRGILQQHKGFSVKHAHNETQRLYIGDKCS